MRQGWHVRLTTIVPAFIDFMQFHKGIGTKAPRSWSSPTILTKAFDKQWTSMQSCWINHLGCWVCVWAAGAAFGLLGLPVWHSTATCAALTLPRHGLNSTNSWHNSMGFG